MVKKRIGVLALQGGFDAHVRILRSLNVETDLVKTPEQLGQIDALIIPGGESTTIGKLLELQKLWEPLSQRIHSGLPVFGTCAGLILLAKKAMGRAQNLLGVMDIDVARNAYGRQTESFETDLVVTYSKGQPQSIPAIFIRAPQVVRTGPQVSTLVSYENLPVCVQQGKLLAATFHPELTGTALLHDYFLSFV